MDRVMWIENFEDRIDPEILNVFPYNFLKTNCFIPINGENGEIIIVTNNPLNLDIGEIKTILKKDIKIALSSDEKINECIEKFYYHPSSSKKVIDDLSSEEILHIEEDINTETANLLDLANKAPVIRIVNQIIYRAISMRASDIHLQITENSLKVRYRIDGILHDIFVLPKKFHPPIVTRIKIMSNLDIAEKRIPQDGRTSIKVDGKKIDIRISIIPTFFGESIVLRLLDRATFLLGLEELGFSEDNYKKFNQLIHCDHGIILLTGPTGSGKTTTLYAALSKINNPGINIVTLEDPVEYNLEGINQIQVNHKVGLTFANGLRSILRHDPNVIMVGEIRDKETAEMAIQASLTGHLVFSTLHTNDASSAIVRLIDMGIETYLLSSSLIGVMAQRLVRLNCPNCSIPENPPVELLSEIGISEDEIVNSKFMKGKGCKQCLNEGYYGRTGIFELLIIDEGIKELILKRASSNDIKKEGLKKGMKTLRMDGIEKVKKGLTTISEVLRVTQDV
ncbi:MAG TPA: type II secretion system ATPase GspE [bacterium]|nr:type II secretion system ATPase GspE [bacterium]HOM27630.1 type II secretion system ATPase GspE [bacterium]